MLAENLCLKPLQAQSLGINLETQSINPISQQIAPIPNININSTTPPEPQQPLPLRRSPTSPTFQDIPPEPQQQIPLPSPLPPPEDLLPSPTPPNFTQEEPLAIPGQILVQDFEFEGNTAFSDAELDQITKPYTKHLITFAELMQARSAITQYYVEKGYITTGAFIPPQTIQNGIVVIRILEGSLEDIRVSVQGRLNPHYIRDRLAVASSKPLNINRLLEALRLLQLNPLIEKISAQLETGTGPGNNILTVTVETAQTFNANAIFDNGRSPSVGDFRRGVQIQQTNLLGLGDQISGWYLNTNGSNDWEFSYSIPINAYNGSLEFNYRNVASRVVEDPFEILNIESDYQKYSVSLRQPIIETVNQSFAVGLTFEHHKSKTSFSPPGDVRQAFPGYGTDNQGRTNISTLRFYQEWINRNEFEVISLLSEFSWGLDAFGTTNPFDFKVNPNAPDSNYFMWRGQTQWVRLLAPDFLLYFHADLQLADGTLVPLEQFGLGGLNSVRGYRQNFLLGDNGFYTTFELRVPVYRTSSSDNVLQIVPFVDVGRVWNSFGVFNPDPQTLASVGLGLQWQYKDLIKARIDWGIPLIEVNSQGNSLQDQGITFSIIISPF